MEYMETFSCPFAGKSLSGGLVLHSIGLRERSHPACISFPQKGQSIQTPYFHQTGRTTAPHPVPQTRAQQVLAAKPPASFAIRANELWVVFESEEKARPAHGKSPEGFFHRLQGFFRAGAEGGI
ncbi:MAG: hypothetical protein HDT18_08525 [Oscillibacter sp.]|nr:hypothetical protein [Oscillibacter sp.]